MKRKLKAGITSQSVPLFIQDASSTAGAGLGSLAYNSSGLAAKYRRQGQSSWTTITLAAMTPGTWTSGGFVSDGGPVTGGYELGIPDAARAASEGVTWVTVEVYGATNMLPVLIEIELDRVDYQDPVRFGLTALPGASAGADGGLPVLSNGAADLAYAVTTLTNLPAVTADWLTAAGVSAAAVAKIQSGLSTYAGGDTPGTATLLTRLTSDRAGYLDNLNNANLASVPAFPANFAALGISAGGHVERVTLADTVTAYAGNTPQTGDAYARLGAPAGASVSADVAAVKADTASLAARVTDTLFSGITSLARWLGALAGKTADAPTQAEIRATAAGAGYTIATDSLEAVRDRGDAAWAAGGLTAGDVWDHASRTLTSADPLEAQVPGGYASGSAGYALGRIGRQRIEVTSPGFQSGAALLLHRGAAYINDDGRALEWTDAGGLWPALALDTPVVLRVLGHGTDLEAEVVVTSPKLIRAEPAADWTASLPVTPGVPYFVIATLGGGPAVLVEGVLEVRDT